MEIQITSPFAAARQSYLDAFTTALREDCGEVEQKGRDRAECELLVKLMLRRAETPSELRSKLDIVFERDLPNWIDWEMMQGAIDEDIARMQRPEPSHTMRSAFELWRNAHLSLDDAMDDDDMAVRIRARSSAFRQILASPCVTTGDFLVKAYIDLLESSGPAVDANEFDPNTEEFADESDNGEAYKRSVYADLDACDLGACLLSFGRTHFNPRQWVERARAVELPFVIENDEIRMGPTVPTDPKQEIEQRRLVRIIKFDPRRLIQLAEWLNGEAAAAPEAIVTVQAKAA